MADLATIADLKAAYPEFSDVTDPVLQKALDDADEEINPAVWGTRGVKGEIALACHLLVTRGVLNDPNASGLSGSGPIQTMRVGDVTLSFDGTAVANAVQRGQINVALATDKYGLEYNRLLGTLACGGAVI